MKDKVKVRKRIWVKGYWKWINTYITIGKNKNGIKKRTSITSKERS
jgi:hypothetical protein